MFCNPSRQFGIREMNIADVLSGHAKLKGIRWVLGSSTAHEVLRDRLRGLLPTGFQLGPCRLREVQFKLRRRLTACYDVLVQKEGSDAKYVRPIAVSWGSSRSTDGQEETDVLAKVQAEAVSRGVAAPFRQLMADYPEWSMHVQVWPLDSRFTQLVRLSDPGHVRGMLAEACALEAAAPWFRRAGAALRAVQDLPLALASPLRPRSDFAAEIQSIRRKSAHIPVLLPQVGSAIEALLDRARELYERLPQEPPSFVHGDFKSEHIWVAADSLTLIDFDDARLGDPALDMGHFLADWQFSHACSQTEQEEVCESFLAGYAAGAPKERFLRVRLYEAIELVRCALRRVQLFEDDWASRTAALVGSAQAVINDLQRILGLPQPLLELQKLDQPNSVNVEESLRYFLRFLRAYWGRIALALLGMVVDAVLGVMRPWPLKVVVDRVLAHKPSRVPLIHHWLDAAAFTSMQIVYGCCAAVLLIAVITGI